MPRKLSEHFTLEEMVFSQEAARKGIDNYPDATILANLKRTAEMLEQVREALGGKSILVSSGYRSPALNKAIGGSKSSAHMSGLAADFTVPSFGTVLQVARKIAASSIQYDQLIHEYGTWIHLGLPVTGPPRRENLSIFQGTGYLKGILGQPPPK